MEIQKGYMSHEQNSWWSNDWKCRSQRIKKPIVVIDYNRTMDGVDLSECIIFSAAEMQEKGKEVLSKALDKKC